MNKTLRIFSVLCVLCFLNPSFAFSEVDPYSPEYIHSIFGSYSTEELLNLIRIVEIEIESRGEGKEKPATAKETSIPVGKYKIGVDIPANTYTVKMNSGFISMITIYSPSGGYVAMYTVTPDAPVGKCELTDGQSIEIVGSPVVFSQYQGLGF